MLERLYVFKERKEVTSFLEECPFLIPLLLEAHYEIEQHFSPSQVFLEVITDPEETNSTQLLASIATGLDPDEALDRLERFDEEWWLDALAGARGKLCIDVEFR
ncbi:MAG: hypothetical protein H5T62_07760 [Anaerolineae bacterium]|nr:hypothetical protein [Anaerolineae bacterium]